MTIICKRTRRPTAPGKILRELYLAPHGVTATAFAEAAGMSRKQISMIVNGRAGVTAETAARIAEVLGTTAQYWLNLQNAVDLFDAEQALAQREGDRQPRRLPAFEGQLAAA